MMLPLEGNNSIMFPWLNCFLLYIVNAASNREHHSRAFTSALIAEKINHRGKKKTQYAELKAFNNCNPLINDDKDVA